MDNETLLRVKKAVSEDIQKHPIKETGLKGLPPLPFDISMPYSDWKGIPMTGAPSLAPTKQAPALIPRPEKQEENAYLQQLKPKMEEELYREREELKLPQVSEKVYQERLENINKLTGTLAEIENYTKKELLKPGGFTEPEIAGWEKRKEKAEKYIDRPVKSTLEGTMRLLDIAFTPVKTISGPLRFAFGATAEQATGSQSADILRPFQGLPLVSPKPYETYEEMGKGGRIPDLLLEKGWNPRIAQIIGETGELAPYFLTPGAMYKAISLGGETLQGVKGLSRKIVITAIEKGDYKGLQKIGQFFKDVNKYRTNYELSMKGIPTAESGMAGFGEKGVDWLAYHKQLVKQSQAKGLTIEEAIGQADKEINRLRKVPSSPVGGFMTKPIDVPTGSKVAQRELSLKEKSVLTPKTELQKEIELLEMDLSRRSGITREAVQGKFGWQPTVTYKNKLKKEIELIKPEAEKLTEELFKPAPTIASEISITTIPSEKLKGAGVNLPVTSKDIEKARESIYNKTMKPIEIDVRPDGTFWVKDGSHRLSAMRGAGIKDIPIISVEDYISGQIKNGVPAKDIMSKATKIYPTVNLAQYGNAIKRVKLSPTIAPEATEMPLQGVKTVEKGIGPIVTPKVADLSAILTFDDLKNPVTFKQAVTDSPTGRLVQFEQGKPFVIYNKPVTVSEENAVKRALKLDWTSPATELKTIDRVLNTKTRQLAVEMHSNDKSVNLIKTIKARGGIRPFAKGIEIEEYSRNVPLYLKNNKGLAPDEMAASLGLEDSEALYRALNELKPTKLDDYLRPARSLVEHTEQELMARRKIMEVLNNAGLGEPSNLPSSVQAKLLGRVLKTKITPEEASELLKLAKEEPNLATKSQKWKALRMKGEIGLSDKEYLTILENITGKKSLSQFKKNPMTEIEAEEAIGFLNKIPILVTPGKRATIIRIMAEQRLTPVQMKRLERLFEIRSPKKPMTETQADNLIEAMKRIPKTKYGESPVIFKGMPDVPTQVSKDIPEGGDLSRSWLDFNRGIQPRNQLFDEITEKISPYFKKYIQLPVRYGVDNSAKGVHRFIQEKKGIFEGISYEGRQKIAKFLLSREPKGKELLEGMVAVVDPLSPAEQKAAKWMREKYDWFIEQINKAEKASGLPLTVKSPEYFTHIRETNSLGDLFQDLVNGDINRMIKGNVHLKAPGWDFKNRKNLIKNVNLDADEVISQYAKQAFDRIHLSHPVSQSRKILNYVEVDKPRIYKELTNYLDFVASGHIKTLGLGDTADMTLGALQRNVPAATMEFNLRVALIQPTAIKNVIVEASRTAMYKGLKMYLTTEGRAFLIENSRVLAARSPELLTTNAPLIGRIFGKRFKHIVEKTNDAGYFLLKTIDGETALMSEAIAYQEALKRGLKGTEAITFADDMLLRTNMSAARDVVSPLFTSRVGRTIGILQTYQLGEWNYLLRNVLGISRKMTTTDRLVRTAKMLAGITAVNMVMEDAIGIHSPFSRPIKTFMEIRKKRLTTRQGVWEMTKEMTGPAPFMGGFRYGSSFLGPIMQMGDDFYKLLNKEFKGFADKGEGQVNWFDFMGKAVGLPGTSQINKMYKAYSQEDTLPIPYSTGERIRMGLLGSITDQKNQLRRMVWEIKSSVKGYEKEMYKLSLNIGEKPDNKEEIEQRRKVVAGYYESLRDVYGELWKLYSSEKELKDDFEKDDPLYFSEVEQEEQFDNEIIRKVKIAMQDEEIIKSVKKIMEKKKADEMEKEKGE